MQQRPAPGDYRALVTDPPNLAPGTRWGALAGAWWCAHPLPLAQLNVVRAGPATPAEAVAALDGDPTAGGTGSGVHAGGARPPAACARWSLTDAPGPVRAALRVRGWRRVGTFEVYARAPIPGRHEAPGPAGAWAEAWFGAGGLPAPEGDWSRLGSLTWTLPGAAAALLVDPGRRAGVAWGARVAPAARGRGAWRALLRTRLAAAAALGLDVVYAVARPEETGRALCRYGFVPTGEALESWER